MSLSFEILLFEHSLYPFIYSFNIPFGRAGYKTKVAVKAMSKANPNVLLVAKANAGIPHVATDGEIVYNGTPEVMAQYARNVRDMGISLIGGCCGSTPKHIRAMAEALGNPVPE